MKWSLTLGVAIGLLIVLIGNWKSLAFLAWMFLFGSSMCGNDVAQEELSPDGELRAVLFQRDCGAMTGFSTQVSIIAAWDDLQNEMGNVFIAPGHPDATATTLHWRDAKTLTITTLALDRASQVERKLGDIDVEYVQP